MRYTTRKLQPSGWCIRQEIPHRRRRVHHQTRYHQILLPLLPNHFSGSQDRTVILTTSILVRVDQASIFLERQAVSLAFQINESKTTGHAHLQLLDPSTDHLIHYIVAHTLRPPRQSSISSQDLQGKGKSRERARSNSLGIDEADWPSDWAIDKPAFRSSLNQLIRKLAEQSLQNFITRCRAREHRGVEYLGEAERI